MKNHFALRISTKSFVIKVLIIIDSITDWLCTKSDAISNEYFVDDIKSLGNGKN